MLLLIYKLCFLFSLCHFKSTLSQSELGFAQHFNNLKTGNLKKGAKLCATPCFLKKMITHARCDDAVKLRSIPQENVGHWGGQRSSLNRAITKTTCSFYTDIFKLSLPA